MGMDFEQGAEMFSAFSFCKRQVAGKPGFTYGKGGKMRKRVLKKVITGLTALLLVNGVLPTYAEEVPDSDGNEPVSEVTDVMDEALEEKSDEEKDAEQDTGDKTENQEEMINDPAVNEVIEESTLEVNNENAVDSEEAKQEVSDEDSDALETEQINDSESGDEGSVESLVEEETVYTGPYSERLLVVSGNGVREEDAVISQYEDLYLIGYGSNEELQEAYKYYQSNALHVEVDLPICVAEGNGDIKDAPNEISQENNPMDQLSAVKAEDHPIDNSEATVVALIDTGVGWDCNNLLYAVSMLGDNPTDDNGHGSRMSNIIAEEDPSVRILSIKAMDASGTGTISSVYAALEYAIEQDVDVISLSASAVKSSENSILLEQIQRATMLGITVVGSAGNNSLNAGFFIPGSSEHAVIAGSCDEDGNIRSFSNFGSTVDYLVVSESTSEAAARLTGIISKMIREGETSMSHELVFQYEWDGSDHGHGVPSKEVDEDFHVQCNGFFYGDAYYWEIPYGETTTTNAKLISGQQQQVLSSKTDTANGYNVQFQAVADDPFTPGHGYAVFASTHKSNAVSRWTGSTHVDDFRGSYEAWGDTFDSCRSFTISKKDIAEYKYLGVIPQQNATGVPGSRAVSSLSKNTSVSMKLGEEGATYWNDVPGVNTIYWEGWDHTSSGDMYDSFRVDFYYEAPQPNYNLTINYLEEGSKRVLAPKYGPTIVESGTTYSVPSPNVSGYELVDKSKATVTGTMPAHDVVVDVYYRYVPPAPVKTVKNTRGVIIDGKSVQKNEVITYEITIKNSSAFNQIYKVVDSVPSATTFVSAADGGTYSNGAVTWVLTLGANVEKKLTFKVRVNTFDTSFTNKAEQIVNEVSSWTNEVKNWGARIRVNKTIRNRYDEYGKPTFVVCIADPAGNVWYRSMELDKSDTTSAYFEVPSGLSSETYTITEMPHSRYHFYSVKAGSPNVTISGKSAKVAIDADKRTGTVSFENQIDKWNELSDADSVMNHVGA